MSTKTCTSCSRPKLLDDFFKDSSRPSGRQSACKVCQSAYRRILEEFLCPECLRTYLVKKWAAQDIRRKLALNLPVRCGSCRAKRVGERHRGTNNPNWKGGTTSESDRFYHSKEWKEVRTQAFIRDEYTCQDCGQVGHKLEANHIKPRSKHPEFRLVLSNIETLCKKCHDKKKWMVYV